MDKKLFVSGLATEVRAGDLLQAFRPYGIVVAEIKSDYAGHSRCFGFITFESEKDATTALNNMNGEEIRGKPISLKPYHSSPQHSATSTPSTHPPSTPLSQGASHATVLTPPAPRKDPYFQIQEAMSLISALTQENIDLKAQLSILTERVTKLGGGQQKYETDALQVRVNQLENSKQEEQDQQKARDNLLQTQIQSIQEIHTELQVEIHEKLDQQRRALNVRVGGLQPKDMHQPLQTVLPMIGRWDTVCRCIKLEKIQQTILTFRSKQDRDSFLQQSTQLKDTQFWLAADLTQKQLQAKKTELQKVRIARSQSKWAVYRDGKAVIQEFKTKRREREQG